MNWEELTTDIAAATRRSFSDLFAEHGDEAFYAFAIYTDEDCYTVVPAANSLEQHRAKMARTGKTDPRTIAYYRWASAEWAYESFAATPFNAICKRLGEASDAASGDAVTFVAFKARVHRAMTDAMRLLDEEGFFGERRRDAVLFITSSDHDEAQAMEDDSARILNRPEISDAFLKRYQSTA